MADTTLLHSTKVEVIWTLVPIVILVAMALPAAKGLIRDEDMSGADMTIKVTGYQWKWEYDYLDQKVDFFSTLARDSNCGAYYWIRHRSFFSTQLSVGSGSSAGWFP